jgi:hypothetical protein
VTAEVLERRPWGVVQQAMAKGLNEVARRRLWFGFFYLCSGRVKPGSLTGHME